MTRTALALLALSFAATPALAAPDGAKLYALQCRSCHADASTPMGPTLKGVAGAPIASRPGYAYSAALKAKTGTWTDANLDAFLKAPMAFAPGSRMPIAVAAADARAAIIAHLKTLR